MRTIGISVRYCIGVGPVIDFGSSGFSIADNSVSRICFFFFLSEIHLRDITEQIISISQTSIAVRRFTRNVGGPDKLDGPFNYFDKNLQRRESRRVPASKCSNIR